MAWPLRKLSTHTDNINEVVIRSSAKLSMISTYNFVIHILHSHNPIDPRGKTLENGCLLLSYFIYLSSYQLYTFNLKIDYCNSYWKSFGIFFEIETDKNPTKFVWLLAINDDISFVTLKMRLVTLIISTKKVCDSESHLPSLWVTTRGDNGCLPHRTWTFRSCHLAARKDLQVVN